MKVTIITIGLLCLFTSAAWAQSPAADPNAIDLSGRMDTIERGDYRLQIDLGGFMNVGHLNADSWEDFILNYSTSGRTRFGGPLLLDTVGSSFFSTFPSLLGDLDADGLPDVVGYEGALFFHREKDYPYFQSQSTCQFVAGYKFAEHYPIGVIDYDGDGVNDLLLIFASHGWYISMFKGGPNFGTNNYRYADDSLLVPTTIGNLAHGTTVAKFGKHLPPMVVWSDGPNTYLVKHLTSRLSDDSVFVIGDSAHGLLVKSVYATDITGDGVTDLLVSDGLHVYIYKGGDDFGSYQLTPQSAYYTIPSPRVLDFPNFGSLNQFGNSGMLNCGDITGSGIPFLAINGDVDDQGFTKSYLFFYAGGKALDSLYDGIIGFENNLGIEIDTLHSINSSGRTVVLVNDGGDRTFHLNDLDLLLSRDCEKIPHTTNPNLDRSVMTATVSIAASCVPSIANRFVKLHLTCAVSGQATISIHDLLGREIEHRDPFLDAGENTEYFDTSLWPSGTYIVRLEIQGSISTTKFVIQH